jgi:hypothetical protein
MSDEKGGSIVFILIVLVCGLLWTNQPSTPKADFTQPVDGLIEQVASVEDSLNNSVDVSKMVDHFPDATKMVDPSPSDKPKAIKREIVIFSQDWCEPCQRWKRCEQSKFNQAGYTFAYGNPDDVKTWPHFIVTDGDKTVEISGYMTLDRLKSELAK